MESILSYVVEKTNLFFEGLEKCKKSGVPTYIYGAGEGACNVERRAESVGFVFEGKIVDRQYYLPGNDYDCLEDVVENMRINIVVAHRGFDKNKLEKYQKNICIIIDVDCFSGNYDSDPEIMTYQYVKDNEIKLTRIYNSLADEKSRQVLIAYINQKISMDYKYLKSVRSDVQYFDPEIVALEEHEALVDAGAYIGDTAFSFIQQLNKQGISAYEAVYSFEPDPQNYKKLSALGIERCRTFMLATSDHKGIVSFSSVGKGSSSVIINEKDEESIEIQTDLIDNVLEGEKVTFIKMDVEGYELASLRGASITIQKQRPKLAICIYHKRSDLWEIQNYLETIVDNYKYYIRAYEDTATELVLYAIPV